jgi:hypothetical protein
LPLENPPVKLGGEPLDVADIRNSLKSLMRRNCGVRRDASGLAEATESIGRWCRYVLSRQFSNPIGWELYEMAHHGAIGAECAGMCDDAVTFARLHGWAAAKEAGLQGAHRHRVTERRETEQEIIVKFGHQLAKHD